MSIKNYEGLNRAVISIRDAVMADKAAGKKRRPINAYKPLAGQALCKKRVHRTVWEEVIAWGAEINYFTVDRNALSYPIFVVNEALYQVKDLEGKPHYVEPVTPVVEAAEDTSDEDTSDDPTVTSEECSGHSSEPCLQHARPPSVSPPAGFYCASCLKPARVHFAIDLPEDDTDFYVDSDGAWKCHTCATVPFSESWGGVRRWLSELDAETMQRYCRKSLLLWPPSESIRGV